MRTELFLPSPPSANSLFANKASGGRVKSKAYKAWIKEAGWMIQSQPHRHHRHTGKVNILLQVRKPDNRRRDISNAIKAVEDLLVRHQILLDDSLVERSSVEWVYQGLEGAKVVIEDLPL